MKISFGTLSLMGTLMASHKVKLCKTKLTKNLNLVGAFAKKIYSFILPKNCILNFP